MSTQNQPRPLQWTADLVRKYWDYYSHFPETYFTYLFGDVIVSRLSTLLPPKGIVLDFGCGTGYLMGHLLDRGYRVWGIDSSQSSIEAVRKRYSGRPGFLGAFLPTEMPEFSRSNAPQVVFAIEVLEHLSDGDLKGYLGVLKQIAKGAKIIVTVPNEERLEDSTVYCPTCDHTFHKWQHVRSWSAQSLTSALKQSGFNVETSFVTDFSVSFSKNKSRFFKAKLAAILKKSPSPHLVVVCQAEA